jgi:uncharacterized C2H2 Zn-finger protein
MKEIDNCPKCNANFNSKDIYQHFLYEYAKYGIPSYSRGVEDIEKAKLDYPELYKTAPSKEELEKMSPVELAAWNSAQQYGWTKENPRCFRREIGIEIPGVWDGVVIWKCPACNFKWKRAGFEWVDDKYLN